jgi:hypothetical protein
MWSQCPIWKAALRMAGLWEWGVSLTLPLPGGKLYLSYTVCWGEELIRQSGWRAWWQRPYRPTPPNISHIYTRGGHFLTALPLVKM